MSAICEQLKIGRGRPRTTKEILLPPLTKSPYARKYFFPVHFLYFFRFFRFGFLVYLENYRKSEGFDSFEPFKKYEPGHPT